MPMHSSASANTNVDAGWLNQLENARGKQGSAALAELPEAMTDPFVSERQRLDATLDSFRFSNTPRSLMDWAVAQTGLDDPLSHYTRHELEEGFSRFQHQRNQHLQSLVRQLKRQGEHQLLNATLQNTRQPTARAALSKAMR